MTLDFCKFKRTVDRRQSPSYLQTAGIMKKVKNWIWAASQGTILGVALPVFLFAWAWMLFEETRNERIRSILKFGIGMFVLITVWQASTLFFWVLLPFSWFATMIVVYFTFCPLVGILLSVNEEFDDEEDDEDLDF